MQPSNNISLLFSLICAHTLSSNFTLNCISVESIRDSYLFQHVMENTRMRENCEPSTLDLILTNDENMIEELNYTSPLGNSSN
jgi:hypothetical protein